MYFIIRMLLIVVAVIGAAAFAGSKAADYTADRAMGLEMQQYLTGLAGIIGALVVGGVFFLIALLNNRE